MLQKKPIIKILAENDTFGNSNSKSIVLEELTMVHSKFRQEMISAKET